jgi:hypothetical protein
MLTVSLLSIPITRYCSCPQSIIFEVCHRNPHELVADLIFGLYAQSFSTAASPCCQRSADDVSATHSIRERPRGGFETASILSDLGQQPVSKCRNLRPPGNSRPLP